MSQEYQFTGNERNTTIVNNSCIIVTYHDTQVVNYNKDTGVVIFDTGGWSTATTRRRINQTCSTFDLPFQAYIKDYQFFVEDTRTGKVYDTFPLLVQV